MWYTFNDSPFLWCFQGGTEQGELQYLEFITQLEQIQLNTEYYNCKKF
jgi:hypothetical protein